MQSKSKTVISSACLFGCGLALSAIFFSVSSQSKSFDQSIPGADRPLLQVLQAFVLAFLIYLVGWATVGGLLSKSSSRRKSHWWDVLIIVAFGILFRVSMVGSIPIQEIDLYRYIWDGAVVSAGHDPFRYSPKTVLEAYNTREKIGDRQVLKDFCELIDRRPGLKGVLEIIHFGQFTSPYPPVSQYCFAGAVLICDSQSTPLQYVFGMKSMLILFDIATGGLLLWLLRNLQMPMTWSLAYWWCPLAIKEIANSGHLDSIVTFFMLLAVTLSVMATSRFGIFDLRERGGVKTPGAHAGLRWVPAVGSAIAMALAVGAKLVPVIIVPLWIAFFLRRSVVGTIFIALIFVIATTLIVWPMAKHLTVVKKYAPELAVKHQDPDMSGIEAFSKFWEMNDLLFMATVENLKPARSTYDPKFRPDQPNDANEKSTEPWFRVTGESFRWKFSTGFATVLHLLKALPETLGFVDKPLEEEDERFSPQQYAFFATRLLTGVCFIFLALWCCWQLLFDSEPYRYLELTFLTIAWFWLLAPTQNPWYWIWAMPFVIFAKGRSWILMSGILFIYYLRFWFDYHYGSKMVGEALGEHYPSGIFNWIFPHSQTSAFVGKSFYDFYLPWYEFGPLLVVLAAGWLLRTIANRTETE